MTSGQKTEKDHDIDFSWIPFYEEVADKILGYKNRRDALIAGIHEFSENLKTPLKLEDTLPNGRRVPLEDICPFTVMGIFNRTPDTNRQDRADKLANFLNVQAIPKIASTGPVIYSQFAWFFLYANERKEQDIDSLWELFELAMLYSESDNENTRAAFTQAYDKAIQCSGIQWKPTIGLYWIRPRIFFAFNKVSKSYIKKELNIAIPAKPYSGQGYLNIIDSLKKRFEDTAVIPNSFPELYRASWEDKHKNQKDLTKYKEIKISPPKGGIIIQDDPNASLYTVDNILRDGCFMECEQLEQIRGHWKDKHNLILQGPPGTGKTWLAKRLAYFLMGEKKTKRVRSFQFHSNLSYEDFVRGWRPDGKGNLTVMNGPFVEMIEVAKDDPNNKYVVVIEEINRGEPAKIFGELLTLLESDKRDPKEALELTYRDANTKPVYVPKNLYVIGTMNIADRSLALVDLAFRRRFAFVDLEPIFGPKWREFVQERYKESENHDINADTINEIELRMNELNKKIENDQRLGEQFRIGHSYVIPPDPPTKDGREWFRGVVNTQIEPLLKEYWFDDPDEAKEAKESLLKDF